MQTSINGTLLHPVAMALPFVLCSHYSEDEVTSQVVELAYIAQLRGGGAFEEHRVLQQC